MKTNFDKELQDNYDRTLYTGKIFGVYSANQGKK
ncbi:hypothetical protein STABA_v1c11100 [Spiroplasma tabanidicola]|uniref:Uncharacterized protein n=1 Tax=Spiroplasma tabanidicola TaxID=324079 RepID=A0A6I6C690_9MOLU|nr:hypothetical protein STABA_v1c11100 [Spiroplasma tabanidicola]